MSRCFVELNCAEDVGATWLMHACRTGEICWGHDDTLREGEATETAFHETFINCIRVVQNIAILKKILTFVWAREEAGGAGMDGEGLASALHSLLLAWT